MYIKLNMIGPYIHIEIRIYNKFNKNQQFLMHIMGGQLAYWFRDLILASQILTVWRFEFKLKYKWTYFVMNELEKKPFQLPKDIFILQFEPPRQQWSATSEFVTEFMDSANEGRCRQKVKCTKVKLEFVMTARNPIGR